MFSAFLAALPALVFTPSAATIGHPLRCATPVCRFSWVPPPAGAPGTPIRPPIMSDDHATIERAAAARAAGIEGYHPNVDSIKAASVDGFGGAAEDEEPITDIVTFGTNWDMRSFAIPSSSSRRDTKLFNRLKAALPTLSLKPIKELKHPLAW